MAYKESELCKDCHAPKVWDHLTGGIHDQLLCEKRQLNQLRIENKKLKKAVEFWKDAWYEVRDLLGNLWWHHPAFDTEDRYRYYKNYHMQWKEKQNGAKSP